MEGGQHMCHDRGEGWRKVNTCVMTGEGVEGGQHMCHDRGEGWREVNTCVMTGERGGGRSTHVS